MSTIHGFQSFCIFKFMKVKNLSSANDAILFFHWTAWSPLIFYSFRGINKSTSQSHNQNCSDKHWKCEHWYLNGYCCGLPNSTVPIYRSSKTAWGEHWDKTTEKWAKKYWMEKNIIILSVSNNLTKKIEVILWSDNLIKKC